MKRLLCCLLAAVAAVPMVEALAQAWPAKPVTLVVPFPPGGSSDQVARALGQKLNVALGQSFIIDNKAGATGTIGATAVKRAAPDGYTWFVTSLGPLVIVPHLMKDLQYDPLKDLDPITIAVQAPERARGPRLVAAQDPSRMSLLTRRRIRAR
jgi:tripartite-type tricarboxylate transporter receptor subunit TctC